jgi:ribulose-phosphate 3-epimerase
MTSTKNLISPSILSADFSKLGSQIETAEAAGADWIHIDVMDGHFVPNLTMGPFIVQTCRAITDLKLDVHLMITNPDDMIPSFAEAGADLLTVHIETCPDIKSTFQKIREHGCQVGVTLNPDTPASAIEPYLALVDLVLVMTVFPGYSGQSFMPEVVPKIKKIRQSLDQVNPEALIEVDGGINQHTIESTWKAGAQVFVAASAIFKHPDGIEQGIQTLRKFLPD